MLVPEISKQTLRWNCGKRQEETTCRRNVQSTSVRSRAGSLRGDLHQFGSAPPEARRRVDCRRLYLQAGDARHEVACRLHGGVPGSSTGAAQVGQPRLETRRRETQEKNTMGCVCVSSVYVMHDDTSYTLPDLPLPFPTQRQSPVYSLRGFVAVIPTHILVRLVDQGPCFS